MTDEKPDRWAEPLIHYRGRPCEVAPTHCTTGHKGLGLWQESEFVGALLDNGAPHLCWVCPVCGAQVTRDEAAP